MLKQIHTAIDKDFDNMIRDIQTLIQCNSVLDENSSTAEHPFGPNLSNCLNKFLLIAESLGFNTVNIGNYAGHAEIGTGDVNDIIGILCHLDTVPFGKLNQWIYPPLSAEIKNGKMYGRGTIDDKGPAVAALYALKAINESSLQLNKRFRLIAGLDEESGYSRCLKKYFEYEPMPSFSFSPDADFPVINAEKGILRFQFIKDYVNDDSHDIHLLHIQAGDRYNVVPEEAFATFFGPLPIVEHNSADISISHDNVGNTTITAIGKAAHAMSPEKGVNSLHKLLFFLKQLEYTPCDLSSFLTELQDSVKFETDGHSLGIATSDNISGPLTCNLAFLKTTDNKCLAGFDIRYPVTADSDIIIKQLENDAAKLGATLSIIQNNLPLNVPADSIQVKALLDAYQSVTGKKGYAMSIGGGTYCRNVQNAVSFGAHWPEDEEVGHQPNEYISLTNLRIMTHIYAESLYILNTL